MVHPRGRYGHHYVSSTDQFGFTSRFGPGEPEACYRHSCDSQPCFTKIDEKSKQEKRVPILGLGKGGNILTISALKKSFFSGSKSEITPLNDVSFILETGDFATIIGPNGSGKSTLLNVIAGYHPCDSGMIILDDYDLTFLPEHKRAWRMARVFQNPNDNLALTMTVEQHLSMAIAGHRGFTLKRGLTNYIKASYIDDLYALNMGLEHKLRDPVSSLSGGQKQALVLLMATIRKPELLLLDECTAGLDVNAADHILRLIDRLVLERRITTLMVIHNLDQALQYGNRLLMLDQGKLILDLDQETKQKTTINDLVKRYKQKTGKSLVFEGFLSLDIN